ncbi:MAG TPA: TonB-dependent receptor [Novosphingobium sp.]|nr:TonB-dependent receptor [Novosphingobium sp.]
MTFSAIVAPPSRGLFSRANSTRWLAGIALSALVAGPAVAHADAASDAAPSEVAETAAPHEEITVTARHRAETSQNVPVAISVLGGQQLERSGAFNIDRLQQQAPTIQFYSSNPRNSAVNIRGLGAPFGLTNDGIEQGVGTYVDDVYYSRAASSTFDFLDVGQIEVLRGPQGTLYGKNTTAGAINITTRQPTFTPEARGEVSFGNYGFKQVKAAVSGPLTDNLAARFAISETSRDGTIYNTTSKIWNNTLDNLGLRAQLLWRAANGLEVTLAGDYNRQNPICCATVYYGYGPTQKATSRQFPALAKALGYTPASTNPYDRVTDLDTTQRAENQTGGVSARVKWNVGPGTLTSVTAWRFWDWNPSNDRDYTGLPITTLSQNPSKQSQYTQELRYAIDRDRYDLQVGVFAFHQDVHTTGTQQQGSAASTFLLSSSQITGICGTSPTAACTSGILNGLTARNDIRLNNTSVALYGQLAWHITDRFTIQPGARLNYDYKKGSYSSIVTDGSGNLVTYPAANATATAQLGVLAPQQFSARYSAWNFSWDVTASYKVTNNINIYATYAKTFKSGGINLNGVPSDASGAPLLAAATVKPESVHHYEAGIKSQFWQRRATLNLAIFRTDISNYQAQVSNGALGVLRGYLANAEEVRSQGVETDFSIRPTERLSLYANGAFTDARYRKFTGAPCPPELSGGTTATTANPASAAGTPGYSPASCDISGQRMPGVSKWAVSWGADYAIPTHAFGREGEFYVGYDGSYRSNFSSNPSASIYTWVAGYDLHNFRAGYRFGEGKFDVFGWVRNATNTNYVTMLTVASGNTGLIAANLGDPRTFGGTFKVAF